MRSPDGLDNVPWHDLTHAYASTIRRTGPRPGSPGQRFPLRANYSVIPYSGTRCYAVPVRDRKGPRWTT